MEFFTLFLITLTADVCGYYFIFYKLFYFARLKIPHVRPVSLLGNIAPYIFRRISLPDILLNTYNLFTDAKYFGFFVFMEPKYVIRDAELIKFIAIKNFDYFCDRMKFVNEELGPIASKNFYSSSEAISGAKCESFSVLTSRLAR